MLSLEEFLLGLALCVKGNPKEHQQFLFDLFDLHNDGTVSEEEVITILHNLKPTKTIERNNEDALLTSVKASKMKSLEFERVDSRPR